MAKIILAAVGSWGDVLPFVALGRFLCRSGHRVCLATNPNHLELVHQKGLEARPCGASFGPGQAFRKPVRQPRWRPALPELLKVEPYIFDTPRQYRELLVAAKGGDVLVSHSRHYAALLAQDRLRIPWVCASLMPAQFRHGEYPAVLEPAPRATLNLLASSRIFSRPDPYFLTFVVQTGFWFFDADGLPGWQPSARLRSLVESARVLVLSLGCVHGSASRAWRLAKVAAEAAARMGRPLVIQNGWVPFTAAQIRRLERTGRVCVSGPVPHDWLFARTDAVIHSGGVGLCARAVRNGVPMLILPQRRDQFFNAQRVLANRAGAAMDPVHATASAMAQLLERKVLSDRCRRSAARLARRIRSEDGIRQAARVVEKVIG